MKTESFPLLALLVVVTSPVWNSHSSGQTRVDSSAIGRPDSIVVKDTVRVRFIPGMGSLSRVPDSLDALSDSQFVWTDSKYSGDLLRNLPGFFLRELGEPGKPNQLNAFGTDWRGISVLLDGRPMNDPVTGFYNLYEMPLEFVDHIEVFSSGQSGFVSSNAPGASVNFVSRFYNSPRPMTKLRYVQEPSENLLTDGLFTQNVARGLNLMVGFQRHVTQGRFKNAQLDAWNLRTRLRYNLSEHLNIALTDFYNKTTNGLNGGVDLLRTTSLFDEVSAVVRSQDASETVSRRDVTLSAIGKFFADSSSATHLSLYYSTIEREFNDPPDATNPSNISDLYASSFSGIRFQQTIQEDVLAIDVGAQYEKRHVDSTRTLVSNTESLTAFFGRAEIRALEAIVPALFVRHELLRGQLATTSGIEMKISLSDAISLSAGFSSSYRFPTMQELYWTDSTLTRSGNLKKESHDLLNAGIQIRVDPSVRLSLTAFQRTIKDALLFQPSRTRFGTPADSVVNVPEVRVRAFAGAATIRLGHFEAQGSLTATEYRELDSVKALVPDIILSWELSYRNRFFQDALDAKVGIRSRFYNRQHGMQFFPQTLVYSENTGTSLGRFTTFDIFGILKLGDVYVSISWENIANIQYIVTPVYPMLGRHFKLGVNWVFLD